MNIFIGAVGASAVIWGLMTSDWFKIVAGILILVVGAMLKK